jgi:hypothetical protein
MSLSAWPEGAPFVVDNRPRKHTARSGFVIALTGAAIGLAGVAVATDPSLVRVTLAILIIVALALISLRSPQSVILLTLCFLPLLALLRRVLIPVAGWTSWDALLMVSPIASLILAHRLFLMERRPIAKDLLSKLVLALVVLALLEVANPEGGGLRAGLTGLLFLAAPLIWFFVGRELANGKLVTSLVVFTVLAGAVTAAYGLLQERVGFPSWDTAWIAVNGYTALNVAGATRAFGTFSSGAEYATFVAVALILAVIAILFGRRRWLLAVPILPLLAIALFLESSRGIIILVLLAIVTVLGLRTGRLALTVVFAVVMAAAFWATVHFFGPQLTQLAQRSGNPFVAHQVAGLMNPFNPERSTYLLHQQLALNGLITSVNHPLGLGAAATNLAGQKLGGPSAGTEVDLTNTFVSLGPVGGLIFLAIVIMTLWRALSLGLSNRDTAALAAAGVLVLTLGQWLNGGYYAVAPLVWILIGWTNRQWLARRAIRSERQRYQVGEPVWGHRQSAATGW